MVTGEATGAGVATRDLERVKGACPHTPLLAGSGVSTEGVEALLPLVEGAIVGSALKEEGYVENPVSRERTMRFVEAFRMAEA